MAIWLLLVHSSGQVDFGLQPENGSRPISPQTPHEALYPSLALHSYMICILQINVKHSRPLSF